MELGSETTPDVPARFALGELLIHQVSSNDEVERRGVAPTPNEAALSQSSTPSLAYRRRNPRSLEPIVRRWRQGAHYMIIGPTPSTKRAKVAARKLPTTTAANTQPDMTAQEAGW